MNDTIIEEMIDEIDWDGNTVATHKKSYMKQRMFIHRVSLVIPRTKSGHYLISMRSANQEPWPSTWVCAIGGKGISGETYEETAIRESEEEVGKRLNVEYVAEFKYNSDEYKAIFYVYTTKDPVDPKDLTPNPKEIQYFKEISLKELLRNIDENPDTFAPTFQVAVRAFVDEIKKSY